MQTAPVILFAYNRPELFKQTLKSLSENELAKDAMVFIFCDGPKPDATIEQMEKISAVRRIAGEIKWCRELHVIESEHNKGLAASIISGVSQVIYKYDKAIIIEDDVLVSPYFLKFMNDALRKYENEEKVLSIGSWNYFVSTETPKHNFFLRYPDSIAWATFKRSWDLFELDSMLLLNKLRAKKLMDDFIRRLFRPA